MTRFDTTEYPKSLLLLLFTAFVLRIGAAFAFDPPLISDDREYHQIAQSIVRGEGFALNGTPTAYRLPAYPYLMGGVYWIFGESGLSVRIIQSVIDVLSCLLTYRLARRLLAERWALSAAWIYALLPITILYTTVRMSESVFTFLFLLYFVALPERAGDSRRIVMSGIVAGLAVLCRSTALLLPLIVLTLPCFRGTHLVSRLRPFAITTGVMILLLVPWLARNEAVFDRFSLTSNGGVNFWMGNHSGASGSYSFPAGNPLDSVADDFARSDLGYRLGFQFMREEPGSAAIVTAKKFAHFFATDYWMAMVQTATADWKPQERAVTEFRRLPLGWLATVQAPFMAIILLALPGFVFLPPVQRRRWLPIIAACVLWIGAHLLIYGTARYRFPLYPLFIIAAVQGWIFLFKERPNTISRNQLIALALFFLILVGGWIAEAWLLFAVPTA